MKTTQTAEFFKTYRQKKGLTRTEFSRLVNESYVRVYMAETGRAKIVPKRAIRWAKTLNLRTRPLIDVLAKDFIAETKNLGKQ